MFFFVLTVLEILFLYIAYRMLNAPNRSSQAVSIVVTVPDFARVRITESLTISKPLPAPKRHAKPAAERRSSRHQNVPTSQPLVASR